MSQGIYLSFYKLNRKPFQISTDPKFLWLGTKHQEALSILRYGIEDDKGFLLLTGDVGTGKTTLLNAFVDSLDNDVIVARVSDPGLSQLDFIKFIAEKFGMDTDFETKSEFLILFTRFLEEAEQDGKKVLLIIDEAQHLTDEILEQIRLLSNIENQDKKLLNIFLVGQNEFNATLEKYKNRALRQRIAISYTLKPLDREETKACIEYRLGVAGVQKHLFTPEAIDAIHTLSEGFPRVINVICDHALFQGCQEKQDEISDEMIWRISKNIRFAHMPQSLGEPGLDDDSDEDWLEEAEEVPPLSYEEINKASQPLPDLQLLSEEQEIEESRKRPVALPLIFLAILLAGVFLLDRAHIDSILQLFQGQNQQTVASPIKPETEIPASAVEEHGEEITQPEPQVVEEDDPETPEIVFLSDQKKTVPENPQATMSGEIDGPPTTESEPSSDSITEDQERVRLLPDEEENEKVQQIAPTLPTDTEINAALQESAPQEVTDEESAAVEVHVATKESDSPEPAAEIILISPKAEIEPSTSEETDREQQTVTLEENSATEPGETTDDNPLSEEQQERGVIEPDFAEAAETKDPREVDETNEQSDISDPAVSEQDTIESENTLDNPQKDVPSQEEKSSAPESITLPEASDEPATSEAQEQEEIIEGSSQEITEAGEKTDNNRTQPAPDTSSNKSTSVTAEQDLEVPPTTPATIDAEPATEKPEKETDPSETEDPGAVIDWLLNSNKSIQ